MPTRTATTVSAGRLLLAPISVTAGLLTVNYLLPGAVLPTTPRALYTTVAVTAAVIIAAEIGMFYLLLSVDTRLSRTVNEALARGDEDTAERAWWKLFLASWTIGPAYALVLIPCLIWLVSNFADQFGWPTTLRGPVDAGITGVIVVLCAKIAFALARSETRRAALFGLVSVAGAWLGFLAALETVGGMRLATEDKRELVLVAAIAAVAFFAVPKPRYRRARTLARELRDAAAALDQFGLRSWLVISPALSLIAQYLGAVLLLWIATWHLGHVLPAPLSFASAGSLFAAAGWVTLARLPVIVGAWFWGPPKESEA